MSSVQIINQIKRSFPNIFASHSFDIGHFSYVKHCIDTGQFQPFYSATNRIPIAYQSRVEEMVEEMLKNGIIENSTSPWNAPIVIVPKKDNEIRLCVDYRKLNSLTNRPIFHIPSAQEIFDHLGGNLFFSTLDLNKGYYQVEISELDREKTAFSTPRGHFQFRKMPFGLCGAPATFQRVLSTVLREHIGKQCCVYLDDIIVFGRTMAEHNLHLSNVLTKLANAGLKLSEKKCAFLKNEVKFLGHIVDKDGIHTDPEKIKAVQNWNLPEKVNELHSFISFANYYRKFIPKFNEIVFPLESLIERKGSKPTKSPIQWNKKAKCGFENLKHALCTAPVLAFPTQSGHFILDCDASDEGIGAVLSQIQDDNERVISYASNKLTPTERNYCATRRELLSIVHYLRIFRHYLIGKRFILRTDHQSLLWLLNWKTPSSKQYFAWIEEILEYDFEIRHRKGESHINADVLSRLQVCKQCPLHHAENKNIKVVRRTEEYKNKVDQVDIEKEKGIKLAIKCHSRLGHPGGSKIFNMLKDFYNWPGMKNDIFELISACNYCLQRKSVGNASLVKKHILAEFPFQTVSMDITGPLPRTTNGNRYILAMIDNFSRFAVLVPLKSMNATEVRDAIENNLFYEYGAPDYLHSDRGTYFLSSEVKNLLKDWDVKQSLSSPYYPKGNSIVERLFRTVKDMIFCLNKEKHVEWDNALQQIMFSLRNCKHEILKLTPFEIIFGYTAKFGEYGPNRSKNSSLSNELLRIAAKALKQKFDVSKEKKIQVKDKVFARIFPPRIKSVYEPKYDGPYEVISIKGRGSQLDLKHLTTGKTITRNRHHIKTIPNNYQEKPKPTYLPANAQSNSSRRYLPVENSQSESQAASSSSEKTPIDCNSRYPRRQHPKPKRLGFS